MTYGGVDLMTRFGPGWIQARHMVEPDVTVIACAFFVSLVIGVVSAWRPRGGFPVSTWWSRSRRAFAQRGVRARRGLR